MANLSFGRHKVSVGAQAIVARPDVPRSTFVTRATHKTTFDSDWLYPIYCEEILPGDSLNLNMTAFVRMSTPLFPIMDNLYVDTFFFFVPNRLVWDNWVKLMGEKDDPESTTEYEVPECLFTGAKSPESLSLFDYFGIPPMALGGEDIGVNALPLRAYQCVWKEWFRDENLQAVPATFYDRTSDGPDDPDNYTLLKRGKRHDYFTSSLPWPQKGNGVSLPLTGSAPIIPAGTGIPQFRSTLIGSSTSMGTDASDFVKLSGPTGEVYWGDSTALEADLTDVLAVSVNTMRAAVATQQLLEKDSRFGTRYVESLKGHFGVDPQDYRLQRPEYLGGSSTPIHVTPVAQTSATASEETPLGHLGGAAVSTPRASISSTFAEHGFVIGLINVRAELSYQQGLHRMWTKRTRYDFAFPVFAGLGEQAVRQDEIYWDTTSAENETVFGYQERYAEYRYRHSLISGMFRSGITGTMDPFHLAQFFADAPMLDVEGGFIESDTPMSRIMAAGELTDGQQFFSDILFNQRFTRPLPMHGTPGLVRF